MASCESMAESIVVTRQCWFGRTVTGKMASRVIMSINWTMAAGFQREDRQDFDGDFLLDLPRGTVPMMSPIYTLPFDGHPGACTIGIAYLIRTYDQKNQLEDVEARFMRRPNFHGIDPDDTFLMPGALQEVGQYIYPLTIQEVSS